MQRSSAPLLCCLYMRPYLQQIVKTIYGKQMRMISSKGGKGNNLLSNKMASSAFHKFDHIHDNNNLSSIDSGIIYKELSSGRLSDEQIFFTKRMRKDLQPRITREENMWRDPNQMDTKWLNPRDPTRYKPNFKNTEPHSMRKQFMRSPDERSRDVLSRDWENAVKAFRDNQRQNAYQTTSSSNTSTTSMQSVYETTVEAKPHQKKTKIQERNNFNENEQKFQKNRKN